MVRHLPQVLAVAVVQVVLLAQLPHLVVLALVALMVAVVAVQVVQDSQVVMVRWELFVLFGASLGPSHQQIQEMFNVYPINYSTRRLQKRH
jgi:hypothetical protein